MFLILTQLNSDWSQVKGLHIKGGAWELDQVSGVIRYQRWGYFHHTSLAGLLLRPGWTGQRQNQGLCKACSRADYLSKPTFFYQVLNFKLPQDFVFRPFLFSIYIYLLGNLIQYYGFQYQLYSFNFFFFVVLTWIFSLNSTRISKWLQERSTWDYLYRFES